MISHQEYETEQISIVKARAMLTQLPERLAAGESSRSPDPIRQTRSGGDVLGSVRVDHRDNGNHGRFGHDGRPPSRHQRCPGR